MSELVAHVRPADGEPQGALVLMHGRGTSEQDLAPLLDVFDPERRLVGLAPRGPLGSPGGRHWYVVRESATRTPRPSAPPSAALTAWLDAALAEHGVGSPHGARRVLPGHRDGVRPRPGERGGRPRPASSR